VLTTAWLGSPDFGAIVCGYFGSLLLSGACGPSACSPPRSPQQVIGFVIASRSAS
jgi:ABC-2 type transport system permease protein